MIYQIRDWDENFENDRSRRVEKCSFVCVPNKQHGMGFLHVIQQPDGAAIYGIWGCLLGACSQQKNRAGWLTSNGEGNGRPWGVPDLVVKLHRPAKEIQRALEVLCSEQVDWIIRHDVKEGELPFAKPVKEKAEGTRIEFPESLRNAKFEGAWAEWVDYRKKIRHPLKDPTQVAQLKEMAEWGTERAVRAIGYTILKGWQGLQEPKDNENGKTNGTAKVARERWRIEADIASVKGRIEEIRRGFGQQKNGDDRWSPPLTEEQKPAVEAQKEKLKTLQAELDSTPV